MFLNLCKTSHFYEAAVYRSKRFTFQPDETDKRDLFNLFRLNLLRFHFANVLRSLEQC